jgi:hypothetical protein
MRGRLAGQTPRWQAGQARISPADSRGTVGLVMFVARGPLLCGEARAHVQDYVDFAMPVSEHTRGLTRRTPAEEAKPPSRPSGGARQGRVAQGGAPLALCECTRRRAFKLTSVC